MPLKPPKTEMDSEKVKSFLQRVEKNLDPEDFTFVSGLVGTVLFLSGIVEKKSSAIARLLRWIFGFKTESSKRIFNEEPVDAPRSEQPHAKGHGRNGAGGYPGARRVSISHKDVKAGDRCPECLKGKLYLTDPGPLMRFFGAAPIQAAIYLLEPNSGIGKATDYMLKRWDKFTRFLTVPGAPFDNNICERALKMMIRHRKNSLYYQTDRGAWVGDLFMSFIHTCNLMKINAFEYITVLLRNADKLAANPARWMPWNCKQTPSEMPP